MKHDYRADIDGLRAIAVLSVLLYHFDFGWLNGGFYGVDIFFVISGFLITRIIRDEVEAGSFRFANFYERRTRRILPSVLATLTLSLIGATLLFTPSDLVNAANALIASLWFVSNIYFWQHIGYFTGDVDVKPLLHMWSLSVEEQFYFIWPLALALLIRKTTRTIMYAVIAMLFIASLASAEFFRTTDPNATFYLLPFRIFEFIIGGAMVWAVAYTPTKRIISEILTVAGLALIAFAVIGSKATSQFPALTSLIPCIGAALIIFASKDCYSKTLISNRAIAYIGLISYQLYLVHWPLYVFYKYRLLEALDDWDKAILTLATFVIAIPMYYYIDKPLRAVRDTTALWRFGILMAIPALVLSLLAISIRMDNGWLWRIDERFRVLMSDPATFHSSQFGGAAFASRERQMLGTPNVAPSFIIFGDSFASQYAGALDKLLKENNKSAIGLFHAACVLTPDIAPRGRAAADEECNGKWDKALALMSGNNLPIVVAHSWHTYKTILADKNRNPIEPATDAEYNALMIGQIEKIRLAAGPYRHMVIIGIAPGMGDQQGVIRCLSVPTFISNACSEKVSLPASEMRAGTEFNALARAYAAQHPNLTFLNARDVVCNEVRCIAFEGSKMYYSDYMHFSFDGAWLFVNHFKDVFLGLQETPIPAAIATENPPQP